MGLQRQLQSIAVTALVCAGGALAQQNVNGTNDMSGNQNQRLRGTSNMTGSTTDVAPRSTNPNNAGHDITPTLSDLGAGTDQGNVGPFVTMPDKQFAQAMAQRAMMEIQLGTVAQQSANPNVKQLGQKMVDDYSRWANGMKKASASLGIELPDKLDAKHQATLDQISNMTGTAFDQAYLKEMIDLQNKALTMAQYEAQNAGVTGFRHWAGVMVPQIQEQLAATKSAKAGNLVAANR